ncbi:MAG: hypothetical protein WBD48_09560 [Pseudolabrys sp.]
MQPVLHSWRNDLPTTLVRMLAYLGGITVLSIAVAHLVQPPPVVAAVTLAPQPEWTEVERPFPAFSLTIPEAADAPQHYAIRRNTENGGRKDILSVGEPHETAPYLLVEIYRPGADSERFAGPADAIAGLSAEVGRATDVQNAGEAGSKFGPVAVAQFKADRDDTYRCLGFARAFDDPRLQIAGLFCRPGNEFIDNSTLTCALDRLTLIAAGSEPEVQKLFAHAELNRSFCGQRDPIIAATPKYTQLWKALPTRREPRRVGR